MHEAGIAQGLLDAAVNSLPPGKVKIIKLVVTCGVLSGVQEECLSMYMGELSKGTPAEGAILEMKVAPAAVVCRKCGHREGYDGSGPVEITCGKCGGYTGLEGGRDEIILQTIEAEVEENDKD